MTKPARDDSKRAAKIRERRKTIALDFNSSGNAILYTNVKSKPFTARRQSFSGRNKMNSLHVVESDRNEAIRNILASNAGPSKIVIDKEIRKICVENAPFDGINDGISCEGKNNLPCDELSTISERSYDRVPTPILIQNALRRARAVINDIDVDCIDKENVAPQNGSLLPSIPSADTSGNLAIWPILQPSIMDRAIPGKLGYEHFNRSLFC